MLKIGYKASAEQFSAQQLLDFGMLAEESGFDTIAVSDHFQPWRHKGATRLMRSYGWARLL